MDLNLPALLRGDNGGGAPPLFGLFLGGRGGTGEPLLAPAPPPPTTGEGAEAPPRARPLPRPIGGIFAARCGRPRCPRGEMIGGGIAAAAEGEAAGGGTAEGVEEVGVLSADARIATGGGGNCDMVMLRAARECVCASFPIDATLHHYNCVSDNAPTSDP